MDAERLRIEEDLRGQLKGEIRCDDAFVELYASDASVFQIRPRGVVRPRTVDDVVATARYATENGLSLHARGAGSSLSGGPLGDGLIVDFSRFFRRILAERDDEATVQSGVVLERLNHQLARSGRRFGPDPANHLATTIGGMIGRDAAGSRWLAYGSTSAHVRSIEAVLADGTVVRFDSTSSSQSSSSQSSSLSSPCDATKRLSAGIAHIAERHSESLGARNLRSKIDRSGYALSASIRDGGVDAARLVSGSEGTLAMITEATLQTVAVPEHVGSCLLLFGSLQAAAEAAVELGSRDLRACDLLDRRHLSLAREVNPRYDLMIPASVEAVLAAEVDASSPDRLADRLRDIEHLIVDRRQLAAGARLAIDPFDQQVVWELVADAGPRLYQLPGASRPAPLFEDIAVAPSDLPTFLQRALATLRRRQVTASIFCHAGSGQVHLRPFVDIGDAAQMEQVGHVAWEIYEHVWDLGGTISAAEGEGLSRTPYMERQHGPLMEAFREVKLLFDAHGILNPGKKVPRSDGIAVERLRATAYPSGVSAPRRQGGSPYEHAEAPGVDESPEPVSATPRTFDLHLDWKGDEMAYAARMCNGCAACRTQASSTRMCPIFRYAPREEAAPRAKANLARGIVTGALPPDTVLSEACKEIADLCVHCHMCRLECPSHVDVPKLMMEAKAGYTATNGLDFCDRALVRIDRLCAVAARVPRLANWAMRHQAARWLLEKTLGIAQGRKLPRISRQPFMDSSDQRRRSESLPIGEKGRREAPRALYFVDTYANYCDTQLARALVAVLEHNGVEVLIPSDQIEAGMPYIAHGLVDSARRIAERNVSLLAEAVRRGYAIVTTEPSAALALRHEYLHLLTDDPDASLVSENTFDACRYLWTLHRRGILKLDFSPLDIAVGYHEPCHLKALDSGSATIDLLNLIPGLQVRPIDRGCSGIAGLFGFKRRHYRRSLRVGLPLISEMRTGRFAAGVTDCSTCRVQMEQGAAKPTVHPIKLLALSYNLMPEIADQLHRTNEPLIVK